MKERREQILKDPEGFKKKQIERKLPDNFDELPEEEQDELLETLEETVISYNPADLKREI